ncbi:CsbD family protein [Methylobacterium sp. sgz302541]|uniref:CsbD family protein n=1 Tax=unclassified Methylobacterium TaxID=2615210 RepID=UPI003D357002
MNRDRIEGSVRHLRGRGKTALGALTGHPRQQVEGAVDQVAGAMQAGYGRARESAEHLRRDGERAYAETRERGRALADEAVDRGIHYRDEALKRGRHYRGEAIERSRALAHKADDNRMATLLVVAAAAFGLGLILRRR